MKKAAVFFSLVFIAFSSLLSAKTDPDAWMTPEALSNAVAKYHVAVSDYHPVITDFDMSTFPTAVSNGILFRARAGDNSEMYLSGTFVNWDMRKLKMKRAGDFFEITVPVKPGKHFYKFITPDSSFEDPANPAMVVVDNYLGYQSMLTVNTDGSIEAPAVSDIFDKKCTSRYFTHYVRSKNLTEKQILQYAAKLNEISEKINSYYGQDYTNRAIVLKYAQTKTSKLIAGFAQKNLSIIATPELVVNIFGHELTHIFLGISGKTNSMMSEGIAVFTETVVNTNLADNYRAFIRSQMENLNYVSLSKIYQGGTLIAGKNPQLLYLQSGVFYMYVCEKFGKEKMLELFHSEDFKKVLGKTLEELDTDFREYLKNDEKERQKRNALFHLSFAERYLNVRNYDRPLLNKLLALNYLASDGFDLSGAQGFAAENPDYRADLAKSLKWPDIASLQVETRLQVPGDVFHYTEPGLSRGQSNEALRFILPAPASTGYDCMLSVFREGSKTTNVTSLDREKSTNFGQTELKLRDVGYRFFYKVYPQIMVPAQGTISTPVTMPIVGIYLDLPDLLSPWGVKIENDTIFSMLSVSNHQPSGDAVSNLVSVTASGDGTPIQALYFANPGGDVDSADCAGMLRYADSFLVWLKGEYPALPALERLNVYAGMVKGIRKFTGERGFIDFNGSNSPAFLSSLTGVQNGASIFLEDNPSAVRKGLFTKLLAQAAFGFPACEWNHQFGLPLYLGALYSAGGDAAKYAEWKKAAGSDNPKDVVKAVLYAEIRHFLRKNPSLAVLETALQQKSWYSAVTNNENFKMLDLSNVTESGPDFSRISAEADVFAYQAYGAAFWAFLSAGYPSSKVYEYYLSNDCRSLGAKSAYDLYQAFYADLATNQNEKLIGMCKDR